MLSFPQVAGPPLSGALLIWGMAQDWKRRSMAWLRNAWAKWRPTKLLRKKYWHVILAVDRQLSLATGFDGLSHLRLPQAIEQRPHDPYSWPLAASVSDQGSDMVFSMNLLRRHPSMCMNLDVVWGLSHGCWNDMVLATKGAQLWSHELIFCCHYNMKFGCWQQERCRAPHEMLGIPSDRAIDQPYLVHGPHTINNTSTTQHPQYFRP